MLQPQHHNANFEQSITYSWIWSWFLATFKYLVTRCITLKYRPHYNLWLNFGSVLCRWQSTDKCFLLPDMSSHAAENRKWIQPVVVLSCKHNVRMRFLNKIQLILEFNLGFQGFINIAQTHPNPEVQPTVDFRVSFMQVTKHGQMFLQNDTSSYMPENRKWIQPVVVPCCKHNVNLTKIQPAVEFRLGFLILVTLWIPHHVTTCVFFYLYRFNF